MFLSLDQLTLFLTAFPLTTYIEAALELARYDKLEDGSFAGEIPKLKGVVAFGRSLRGCESELRSTLEDWILAAGQACDGFAYVVRDASTLCVLDVRDPLRPEFVGSCEIAAEVNAIVVHDGLGFVAAGTDGLAILDLHNPRQPFERDRRPPGCGPFRPAATHAHQPSGDRRNRRRG